MKFFHKVSVSITIGLTVGAIASPTTPAKARRDLASIKGVLSSVGTQVTALDGYITAEDPDPTQIVDASTALVSTLHDGTATVQASDNLSEIDALGLVSPVQTLSNNVNKTVTDLIGIKSTVDSLGYGCTTYEQLEDQLTESTALSDALVSKVPSSLKSIAEGLAEGITSAIQNGVTAYTGEC